MRLLSQKCSGNQAMLIQWVPMNAGRGPASACPPVAARSMPRVFPRTPAGVRVDFLGLGFRGCGPQKTRPLPPANIPASLRDAAEPSPRDGRRLAGGKARPPLPSDTPGRGTGQTNASRRDARKAILDTVFSAAHQFHRPLALKRGNDGASAKAPAVR